MQLQALETSKWELVHAISSLRKEAAKLNTPSTYAKCAKCQRQMNAKEKQLAEIAITSTAKTWEDDVQRAAGICKVRPGVTAC